MRVLSKHLKSLGHKKFRPKEEINEVRLYVLGCQTKAIIYITLQSKLKVSVIPEKLQD